MSRAGIRAWARRRDQNEPELLTMARQLGCLVQRLEAFDALLYQPKTQRFFMIDIKMPKGKPTPKQQQLIQAGWPLHYVASSTQLLALLGVTPEWPAGSDR
jgi:hypothetical protein